jgi:mannosyl-3-phosphoglycerate phosphatase
MKIDEPNRHPIIFTDLDGTLLDHHSYDFSDATPMLNHLSQYNIPLIIVTSKTEVEVRLLQERLGISHPFIVENGAGIFLESKRVDLGFTYDKTLEYFKRYAQKYAMRGFHQLSDEEVANLTELSVADAHNAKQRTYSEPFLLTDESQLEALKDTARSDGFDIVKGGRFYHLITQGQDKANAIKWLINDYHDNNDISFFSIALGDGENDITMLQSVDYPILIPKHDGSYINCEIESLIKAPFAGPKGWNHTLKELLNVK